MSESQVMEQMEGIRKLQQAKAQEMVNEGKKVKKVGGEGSATDQGTDSKVGEYVPPAMSRQESPPEEFTNIFPTDQRW